MTDADGVRRETRSARRAYFRYAVMESPGDRVRVAASVGGGDGAAAEAEQLQLADTAYTGGSRAVTSNHVAPASPEPNTSPVVEPK